MAMPGHWEVRDSDRGACGAVDFDGTCVRVVEEHGSRDILAGVSFYVDKEGEPAMQVKSLTLRDVPLIKPPVGFRLLVIDCCFAGVGAPFVGEVVPAWVRYRGAK